jgi:hypothetical protein
MKVIFTSRAIALGLLVAAVVCSLAASGRSQAPESSTDHEAVFKRQRYFPRGSLSTNEWSDRFKANWYSRSLTAMKEPSLSVGQKRDIESYRFLWLRSFDNPIVVRIWRSQSNVYLITKQLDGDGGRHPGKLVVNKSRSLSMKEWDEFITLLGQSSYWTSPTTIDDLGNDGAQWILEGAKEGRYHIVDRWTPKADDNHRKACWYLVELSGLKPEKIY